MRTTADTSLIVASFASWHEHHAIAAAALERVDLAIAHCLLETYSVLTRLPAPHRIDGQTASTYLRLAFGRHALAALPASEHRRLVATCAANGLVGGAIYDAVIAATCARADAKLLTLDARARPTYALVGIAHELLA